MWPSTSSSSGSGTPSISPLAFSLSFSAHFASLTSTQFTDSATFWTRLGAEISTATEEEEEDEEEKKKKVIDQTDSNLNA